MSGVYRVYITLLSSWALMFLELPHPSNRQVTINDRRNVSADAITLYCTPSHHKPRCLHIKHTLIYSSRIKDNDKAEYKAKKRTM